MTIAEILDALLVPRENGSGALAEVAAWIEKAARATGGDVAVHEFSGCAYLHPIAGLVVLGLAAGMVTAVWRRRFAWALACALALPAYLGLEVEHGFPLASALFSQVERNIEVSFPVSGATQMVILGAHYDTITELIDPYRLASFRFLLIPVALITITLAVSGWRRLHRDADLTTTNAVLTGGGLYYSAIALALLGGLVVPARSPGAIDNGAAVAALLKVAEALGAGEVPLERTTVRVVFFAGSEVAAQGSDDYVTRLRQGNGDLPMYFVNAEALGLGPDLRYFVSDRTALRRYDASAPLVRVLDGAARAALRKGITPDPQPITTDTRRFIAAGIPSVCLASSRGAATAVRGLHSARDTRDRIDLPALERSVRFYRAALLELDKLR